ncbi:sugar transporter ERD6-like 16 isoform X2 [Cryptomeria japonica]|uniref:sugar transporter ERD6-like 16 isoform X2 n=1 Tax=Cryptomeria japonica TaxID=3369 RepID=UPI0027DA59FC|nr:sugar transporter ERD6-like 16 isoform X2 [Cryptomeria japonica]
MEREEYREKLEIGYPLITARNSHESSILIVVISTFIVVMGSLNFGFGVGFSSPSESGIMEELGLSTSQYSVFGSLLTVGAMIGAIMSGYLADYLGRKGALRLCSLFYLVGWLTTAFSKDIVPLDIARLLVGFGAGLTSYTVPVYIAEISPKNMRGGLTTTNQLFITTGILIVYLLGTLLKWRVVALIGTIPSILLAAGLFLIPESPRWLAKAGRDKDFKEALQALRENQYDVSYEATEIMEYVEELESLPKARIIDLFHRNYAPAVIVGVGLVVCQQLCGINGVIFYASAIFKAAGYSSGQSASVGIAILQVPLTAVGAMLMDKSGRRPLLMIAAGGMSVSCFIVGLAFYILRHSQHSALQLVGSRLALFGLLIFPINMKGIAGSLVSLVAWFGGWIVTVSFNSLLSWSAAGSFFIFCGVSAFTVLFVAKLVPETKGRTLEEIQSSFKL